MTAEPKGLPRATFAKLSPHPYLLANLEPPGKETAPSRSNGRAPSSARPPTVNNSSLSHANGSSLVRLGDTTVICGVRAETVLATDIPNFRPSNRESELADYDLLVPNIELATGCSPQFLPGQPPSALAQTLSTRVYSLLHASRLVSPESLRIWYKPPGEAEEEQEGDKMQEDGGEDDGAAEGTAVVAAYWVLYIDILFISFDGNPFDAAWAAVVAALRDTRLPQARWDPDREMVLCARGDGVPLAIDGLPIACTAVVFTGRDTDRPAEDGRYWLLLDPDRLEESLCDETVTAVVDCSAGAGQTRILSIGKHGGVAGSAELVRGYVAVAEKRWAEFHRAITASS